MNIEAERAKNQMTKSALYQTLGITSKTYNSYISGNSIPSTKLEKMADLFGCSIDYLLGRCSSGNRVG